MSWGWYSTGINPERIKELGFDPDDPTLIARSSTSPAS